MPITILDGILIVFTLVSAILAMIRGLSRELFSVFSWTASSVAAYFFYHPFLPFIETYVKNKQLAIILAGAIIFFVTLIALTIITMKIADLIVDSCLGALDRTLGFIYGALRGVLVVAISFFFFSWLTGGNYPSWVKEAKSLPILEQIIVWTQKLVPEMSKDNLLEKILHFKNEMEKGEEKTEEEKQNENIESKQEEKTPIDQKN